MSNDISIRIRPATEEDIPFIFNSWLKSYRNSFFARDVPPPVYFTEHHKVLEDIVKTNTVLVACNPDESNQIYGYMVAGTVDNVFVLQYAYVKHPYRSLGVGKLLLKAFNHEKGTAGFHTHSTRAGRDIAIKYNLVYSPYICLRTPSEEPVEPETDAKE